ncbi:MAG TPA: nitronate monooxygenase [Nitrospirota bacterium]|nr:nitronate monooxygenase [Nitrospirota bacterium]
MSLITPVTQTLGIEHPILLAPMDLIADGRLVAAVHAAGGFGILGGGYGEEEWLVRELDVLDRSRARFGVGFITWSMGKQPRLLDIALERRPVAVMLSFGSPASFIDRIKRTGALVICQVQSVALAQEAVAAGADLLVAQGTEAGGHGASRGLITLVPEIVDAVGTRIPIVAAGGIADGRGLAAALMLGAAGVLMGTRFYATQESAGAPEAKERICAAAGDDTLRSIVFDISRRNVWPAPFTGRCLRNVHTDRWFGREVELMRHLDEESAKYVAAREAGDFDIAAVIAGEAAGLIRDIPSAHDVIERVVREASSLLARLPVQMLDARKWDKSSRER